jgi:hypothetical protein
MSAIEQRNLLSNVIHSKLLSQIARWPDMEWPVERTRGPYEKDMSAQAECSDAQASV